MQLIFCANFLSYLTELVLLASNIFVSSLGLSTYKNIICEQRQFYFFPISNKAVLFSYPCVH